MENWRGKALPRREGREVVAHLAAVVAQEAVVGKVADLAAAGAGAGITRLPPLLWTARSSFLQAAK
jgi:hypothetical protein